MLSAQITANEELIRRGREAVNALPAIAPIEPAITLMPSGRRLSGVAARSGEN
jgi:hypothetical protein